MKSILTTYEVASGQVISLPKSEIYYSRNVDGSIQDTITSILGVQAVLGTGKYLGLPSMIGRNNQATFSFIKDRVWQKINSWSSKCLSKARKEVMIKSVLQSILSYIMSIFLLPSTLIDSIEKMLNAFWWGNGGNNARGIHWLSWDKLTVHKKYGGMGFKDLTAFNMAMLGKQDGNFKPKLIAWFQNYSKHDIFLALIILVQKLAITQVMCGGAFLVQRELFEMV